MRKLGAVFVVLVAGVAAGLLLSRKPWIELSEQRTLTNQAETDMRQAETKRAQLVEEESRRSNPIGRERTARINGYRRPNEVPAEEIK